MLDDGGCEAMAEEKATTQTRETHGRRDLADVVVRRRGAERGPATSRFDSRASDVMAVATLPFWLHIEPQLSRASRRGMLIIRAQLHSDVYHHCLTR